MWLLKISPYLRWLRSYWETLLGLILITTLLWNFQPRLKKFATPVFSHLTRQTGAQGFVALWDCLNDRTGLKPELYHGTFCVTKMLRCWFSFIFFGSFFNHEGLRRFTILRSQKANKHLNMWINSEFCDSLNLCWGENNPFWYRRVRRVHSLQENLILLDKSCFKAGSSQQSSGWGWSSDGVQQWGLKWPTKASDLECSFSGSASVFPVGPAPP